MKIDWNGGDTGGFLPGVYLAEVANAEEKRSKSGDAYFNLRLDSSSLDGETRCLCYDIVMCQGKGAGIGLAKLKALGFDSTRDAIEPSDLKGRRVWVNVDWDEYEGKKRLKIVTEFNPFECGMWAENDPPEGATSSVFEPTAEPVNVDDTPF